MQLLVELGIELAKESVVFRLRIIIHAALNFERPDNGRKLNLARVHYILLTAALLISLLWVSLRPPFFDRAADDRCGEKRQIPRDVRM